jgi:hypothetical protein
MAKPRRQAILMRVLRAALMLRTSAKLCARSFHQRCVVLRSADSGTPASCHQKI